MSNQIERYCVVMHDAYEKAAAGAGWETNPASRKPWADVPEPNKVTMRAAVAALLEAIERDKTPIPWPKLSPQLLELGYRWDRETGHSFVVVDNGNGHEWAEIGR